MIVFHYTNEGGGCTYRVTEIVSHITVEGYTFTTYGIGIESDTGCATVEDISPKREAVATLRRRIEAAQLSPLHLRDVVEDWFGE